MASFKNQKKDFLIRVDMFRIVKTIKTYCRLILTALVTLIGPHVYGQRASPEKPNIVFILVDDMGWKDLGIYGSKFYESPHIDQLAREGMLFTDAYSSSNVCSPSRSSIMTGQYPVHTGITDWIVGQQNIAGPQPDQKLLPPQFSFNLDTAEVTIAEALKKAGYATCYAGKWHLGLTPDFWPGNQGFDYNYGGWAAGSPVAAGMGGYFSPYHNPRLSDGPKGEFLTDRLTTEAIGFIRKQAEKKVPFFVDLSFYAVHEPVQAKKVYIDKFKEKAHRMGLDTLQQFIRNDTWMRGHSGWAERVVQDNPVYAGLIYSVDENVGRIINVLKQLGIAKTTIVIFTSDNGGLNTTRNAPTTNYPLRYGKGWNYEGGIRVPLIVKWPGLTTPGTKCSFPVINTDFYPTMLQMAGLPLMPRQHLDGISMVPLLEGKKKIGQPGIYWHYPHYHGAGGTPSSAIREGNWKLIQFYEDNHIELYNLRTDIEERQDLAPLFPKKAAEMLNLLNTWKRQTHAGIPTINPYYNPDYEELINKGKMTRGKYMSHYDSLFGKDTFDPNLFKSIMKRDKMYIQDAEGKSNSR
jgi:arylsulfatase A-like enzyme